MKKKTILLLLLLLVLISGVLIWLLPAKKAPLEYETVTVEKGSINNTVTATGTVEPITQVEVGTQVSGTISRIYVDFNSEVKEGQLLAELERTLLESELSSQRANLASAKTEYEYQQKNYARIKGLHDKQLVSDTEFETAFYQYDKALRSYEKSQSDMVKAQTNLGYAMIYSPIDGVVLSRDVDEGQTVAASFNTPTLFTIANDLRKMQVVADVDEADIGQVKEGQRVTFTVDAFPDDTFEGSVMQVRLQATTTSNVVTYQVIVDAPNPDLKLMPGLTANITVYTLQRDNLLLVPIRAFRFIPDNQKGYVPDVSDATRKTLWLKTPSGLSPAMVTVGDSDGIYMEVTGGVNPGDQVVTGYRTVGPVNGDDEPSGENNPFMPQRPGQRRR